MTRNHDYNTPAEGTTDWHVPLNENFERIDTDVEVRDVDSARSSYEPKKGALYRATDTGDVYLGDGESWTLLNPPSGDRGNNIYGKVAAGKIVAVAESGSTTTVDPDASSTPVQTAIDAIGHSTPGTVLLPPGTIEEDGSLVGGFGKRIVGWHPESTTVRFTHGGHGIVVDGANRAMDWSRSYVHNLTLDGGIRNADHRSAYYWKDTAGPMHDIGRIVLERWGDKAVYFENDAPWSANWEHLYFGWGNNGRNLVFEKGGTTNLNIGNLTLSTYDESPAFWTETAGVRITIDTLQVERHCGSPMLRLQTGGGYLNIGQVHMEVSDDGPENVGGSLINFIGPGSVFVGQVGTTGMTFDSLMDFSYEVANKHIGMVVPNPSSTVNKAPVTISGDLVGPNVYTGSSEDVMLDGRSSVSMPLSCIGDMNRVG